MNDIVTSVANFKKCDAIQEWCHSPAGFAGSGSAATSNTV